MPKQMIVPQPTPQPTPLVHEVKDMVRRRLKRVESVHEPEIGVEKKAAKEAIDSMVRAARAIPGVEAFPIGEKVKVRITGESFADIATKIGQLPPQLATVRGKTMCDGEPVRIT